MSAPINLVEDLTLAAPASAHHGLPWWWPLPAAVLLAAVVVFLRHRRQRQMAAAIPPEKTALAALADLRTELEALDARAFALRLSLILRVYIEGRFGLHAPSYSTEEFLVEAGQSSLLSPEYQTWIAAFLLHCDRSKFALADLETDTKRSLHEDVLRFVQATTPTV